MNRSAITRLVAAVAIVAIVAVVGAAAAGIWYLFLRPAGPAPVSVASPATSEPAASEPSTSMDPSVSAGATANPASGLDGTWSIDPSIGSFADFSGSFVGYRVQEELAGVGGQVAIGRTPGVTGTLTLAGTQVTGVDISADLSTLQSDDDRRDNQLRRQALETGQFPEAGATTSSGARRSRPGSFPRPPSASRRRSSSAPSPQMVRRSRPRLPET